MTEPIATDPVDDRIAEFYNDHLRTRGYAPSIREICRKFGFRSTSSVHTRLDRCEAAGLIAGRRRKAVEW